MSQEWLDRAAGGDAKAFARIVDQYKGYLMAVILPIVRDADQAQDVLQEALWQVYRSLPGFRGGNFKVWLGRIAVNKAVDWQRGREKLRREITAAAPGEQSRAAARSAEDEWFARLTNRRVAALLNNLPPPYRATLTGYFLEGKSYRQLADEAGVTVKTVESRLYRARRILKEQLKEGL